MPPKKKGGGKKSKKGGKGKGPTLIGGVPITEMTREQLEGHIGRLQDEINQEREERNYFQLERDKIHSYWNITRAEQAFEKDKLRQKEQELQDTLDQHRIEIKVYKQKVKYLVYEQQSNVTELKVENLKSVKAAEEEFQKEEKQLLKDKHDLKLILHSQDYDHQQKIENIQLLHSEEMSNLRKKLEKEWRVLHMEQLKRIEQMKEDYDLKHNTELAEVEERRNKQMDNLIQNHQLAFTDMRNYFNDLTLNNLALIAALKEEIAALKLKEEKREKQMEIIRLENKNLVEPLDLSQHKAEQLEKKLRNYQHHQKTFASTKTQLKKLQKAYDDLKWEHEALVLKYDRLEEERNETKSELIKAILELQQKSNLKRIILDKKLKALSLLVEQQQAQMEHFVKEHRFDKTALQVQEILNKKIPVDDLKNEINTYLRHQNEMVNSFQKQFHRLPRSDTELSGQVTPGSQ